MDCIAIVQNIDEDYFVQNFEFECSLEIQEKYKSIWFIAFFCLF